MNRYLLVFMVLFLSCSLSATERDTLVKLNQKVQLISKHYESEIVLRWAPTDEVWWYYGIKEGFEISRRDLSDPNSRYTVLEHNFMPWTEDEMVNWYAENPEDEEIIVPLQTIHREWENTLMDGNNIEAMFDKSTFFKQRHQMTILASDLHPLVADASGLRYVDKSIDPEKTYSYRVRYNKRKNEVAYSIVRNNTTLNKPILFEVLEMDGAIQLKWEKELHQRHFTSYYIEKSLDGSSFERLNRKPYVNALSQDFAKRKYFVFTDSVQNYQPYFYRIIGVDAFGDSSQPSDLVKVTGKDRTPPEVGSLIATKSKDESVVTLNWAHANKKELGVALVYKNDYYDKAKLVCKYEDNIEFECVDDSPTQGMNDYYLVLADTVGNVAQSQRTSVYFKDKFAPRPPTGLKADVDTMGRIILTWDEGPEDDILGYYIFTADHKGKNFIKLNPQKHLYRLYVDSVGTQLLTEKRYYKILAMDQAGNTGEYSEVLEVTRPDKIPPAPALFYNYRVKEDGIYLGLTSSSSIDVLKHYLYRQEKNSTEWDLLFEFGKKVSPLFHDDKVQSNQRYTYKLIAEDDAGLRSTPEPSTITLKAFDTRVAFLPELKLTETDDGINIKVNNEIPGEDFRIELVRSFANKKFRTLTTINEGLEYVDKYSSRPDAKLEPISYRARILYKDGKRSKYSEVSSISFSNNN